MRRPLSIMRADPASRLDRRAVQNRRHLALRHLSQRRKPGDQVLSLMGPIGKGFTPHPERSAHLVSRRRRRHPADGVPRRILARGALDAKWQPLVLMGSEIPFPFRTRPSTYPDTRHALQAPSPCMPLLEEWGIPSRLSSLNQDNPRLLLLGLRPPPRRRVAANISPLKNLHKVEMFTCGPTPMLKAAADVARMLQHPPAKPHWKNSWPAP